MKIDRGARRTLRTPPITIILGVLSLALAVGLVISLTAISRYKAQRNEAVAAVESIENLPEPEPSVPISVLKDYAGRYGVTIEFIQRFLDDQIAYYDGGNLCFADVDNTLKKNSYDFSNLVSEDGELKYVENGVNAAKKGVDVSKYQGDIDWDKVKADGVEYAVIRLGRRGYTEGNVGVDEYFHQNMDGAIKAGIKVGAYFYSQAVTEEEAAEEAQLVIDNLKDYKLDYPVVFDSEEIFEDEARTDDVTASQMTDITIAFCDKVAEAGYTPMVYGNIKWFMTRVELDRLEKYEKWFAQYFNTPFFPYDFSMWQYTARGAVDGIDGDVDVNLCFKDYGENSEAGSNESSETGSDS